MGSQALRLVPLLVDACCTAPLPPPLQDPAFRASAAERFLQLRSSVWTDAAITKAIKDTQAYMQYLFKRYRGL